MSSFTLLPINDGAVTVQILGLNMSTEEARALLRDLMRNRTNAHASSLIPEGDGQFGITLHLHDQDKLKHQLRQMYQQVPSSEDNPCVATTLVELAGRPVVELEGIHINPNGHTIRKFRIDQYA